MTSRPAPGTADEVGTGEADGAGVGDAVGAAEATAEGLADTLGVGEGVDWAPNAMTAAIASAGAITGPSPAG